MKEYFLTPATPDRPGELVEIELPAERHFLTHDGKVVSVPMRAGGGQESMPIKPYFETPPAQPKAAAATHNVAAHTKAKATTHAVTPASPQRVIQRWQNAMGEWVEETQRGLRVVPPTTT
jgi:hypothetical protein